VHQREGDENVSGIGCPEAILLSWCLSDEMGLYGENAKG